MAKNAFLDWDTTASNNTDLGGIGIQGTNAVSNFDDALRTMMAQLRSGVDGEVVYASKSGNYTALANDNNALHRYTATATVTLTAAATLGANWHYTVVANGADVTIDPNGAETIDGKTTLTVRDGTWVLIVCDGTNFKTNLSADPRQPRIKPSGLILSNNVSDATNDIDIATGEVTSDGSVPYLMILSSALTKRLDAAWAVGTNQGGLDTGAIANTTYHVWLIQRSDTGVVDVLFSTSATSPTMPANYDRKRRIGAIIRESAAIVGFFQLGQFFYRGPKIDYDSTSALASQTVSLSVPTGIRVQPIISSQLVIPASSNVAVSFGAGQGTATGFVGQTGFTGTGEAASDTTQILSLITNTNRQIYLEVSITSGSITTCRVRTHGWIDDL